MCGLVKETSAPGKFVYRTDLPIPQINDDEVLIKVHCTAVCGTDLHIMEWDQWSQTRVKTPLIPGHETAGDIVEVGKNVRDRKVGDRVSCETHIPCGTCWFCMYGDNVFEKDGIRRDKTGDGEKTRCLCGKRGIFNRDGPAMGPQIIRQLE